MGAGLRRAAVDASVVGLCFAGGVHLGLAPERLAGAPWLGRLFLADAVALFAAALWLGARPSPLSWRVAGWTAGLTALASVAWRTLGPPGEGAPAWDRLGAIASSVEAAVAGAALLLRRARPGPRPALRPAPWPALPARRPAPAGLLPAPAARRRAPARPALRVRPLPGSWPRPAGQPEVRSAPARAWRSR
jgi:hypothetical protein